MDNIELILRWFALVRPLVSPLQHNMALLQRVIYTVYIHVYSLYNVNNKEG